MFSHGSAAAPHIATHSSFTKSDLSCKIDSLIQRDGERGGEREGGERGREREREREKEAPNSKRKSMVLQVLCE